MKRNTIYIILSLIAFLFSCSDSDTNEQEDFEDITEFILCSEIQFTEDLNSCFTVDITSSSGGESYENCLDNSSNICLNIPAQELITFEIGYTHNCGNAQTYIEIHGPFIFDPSLDDVLITVENSETYANYNISGTVNDCNNHSTTNGAVILNLNGKQLIQVINDGAFEFNGINCTAEDTYSIFAIDFNTNQISETLTFPSTDTNMEIGLINTCSALEEMITYQISDHSVITYQNVAFQAEDNSFYKEVTYNSNSSESFFSLI
ncbi:hypothetical protein P700755_004057 [Psychroflexus torquis ATCC 700755]|uniref:Lipoprotein n=1 Tax=Psychroflexus torquis (strain ATCC 700755 / CIP 106069 / ACAM 623) TaxID=313595 RepID=K4IJT8_PSYTT|nr:hypothetical protein [Psychroflexus torquis]AFU70604.1 hypothetical protein P700755_004057 [Psychroflexus torquis ATCC 700755]